MPYTRQIQSGNPTLIVFLLDQSKSMNQPMAGDARHSKADAVADTINRFLYNIILRCAGKEIKDRIFLSVLGYASQVKSVLPGVFASEMIVKPSELANAPLMVLEEIRVETDARGNKRERTIKRPIWVEAKAAGNTAMNEAIAVAVDIVHAFLQQHPHCFPPIVINITDGKPTDADPRPMSKTLRSLQSSDGNVLLFNLHISSEAADSVLFPADEDLLPDDYARVLFRMSSPLPEPMCRQATAQHILVSSGSRGFAYNADLSKVIQFLEIGTANVN